MSDPLVRAFFIGRAVAETISDQVESAMTKTFSDIGQFDAEQRENIRQFANQVIERANREEEVAMRDRDAASATNGSTVDMTSTSTSDCKPPLMVCELKLLIYGRNYSNIAMLSLNG